MRIIIFLMLILSSNVFAGKMKGQKLSDRVVYDFSVSSATSATPHSLASYPDGTVITNAYMIVSQPISPSAMSVDVGFTSDADGIFGALVGSDTTSGTVITAAGQASPLLWDDTNDHEVPYRVVQSASHGDLKITFDDDPIQGKVEIYIEFIRPVQDAE